MISRQKFEGFYSYDTIQYRTEDKNKRNPNYIFSRFFNSNHSEHYQDADDKYGYGEQRFHSIPFLFLQLYTITQYKQITIGLRTAGIAACR